LKPFYFICESHPLAFPVGDFSFSFRTSNAIAAPAMRLRRAALVYRSASAKDNQPKIAMS
jgi:hypothetical protein